MRFTLGAGFGFLAGTRFTTSVTALIFLAAIFFRGVLAGLVFEVFALVFVRPRVERGLAAVVFFGFFMATVLALGRVRFCRLSPVFQGRNGYLNFSHQESMRHESVGLSEPILYPAHSANVSPIQNFSSTGR
ncbi:MAG TPA: hypothetical protein VHC44_18415 [Verrucomicrobiae bacterium]|nr:hypothetical protein [Verrucomicrobiae bacterium]